MDVLHVMPRRPDHVRMQRNQYVRHIYKGRFVFVVSNRMFKFFQVISVARKYTSGGNVSVKFSIGNP